MRVEGCFLYWAIWFRERDQNYLQFFFLDTDQKISELVARLWRGWSLPRKRWLWDEGEGEQYVNIEKYNRISSVFPALRVCYLQVDSEGEVYCSFIVVKSQ